MKSGIYRRKFIIGFGVCIDIVLSFHKNNVYCAIPLEYIADHNVPSDVYNDCVSFCRQRNDITVALTTSRVTVVESSTCTID